MLKDTLIHKSGYLNRIGRIIPHGKGIITALVDFDPLIHISIKPKSMLAVSGAYTALMVTASPTSSGTA